MRNHRHRLAAIAVIGMAALATTAATAGEWRRGCRSCFGDGYTEGQTFLVAPTYVYAQPTVTIVPRYVIQPNYIVHRTYVIRPTRVVEEPPQAPCVFECGGYYIVDQGQFGNVGASRYPAFGDRTADLPIFSDGERAYRAYPGYLHSGRRNVPRLKHSGRIGRRDRYCRHAMRSSASTCF
jgi:hypothetical protein